MNHLTVVQLNDSHAYLEAHQELFWTPAGPIFRQSGGFARISALLKQIRAEQPGRVLFCDCGDTLHGTYPAVQTQGKAVIPALNSLQPAAMTAHWEFAYTPTVLQGETKLLDFPMLAMNVYEIDSGKRIFPEAVVVEAAGLHIGLMGIASNIIDKTMPPAFSRGVRFTDGRSRLPEIIARLRRDDRVDLVILISHLGFPQDMALLNETPGVDLCLSAHTHHRLEKPAFAGSTLVIQSGSHGSFLGRLDLTVDGGRIVDYRHRLVEVSADLPEDSETAALIHASLSPYREMLAEVVGQTSTDLYRGLVFESTLDNFILQTLLEQTGAEAAFSNGWRYGAPVTKGPLTLNDLYNMVPADPPISTTLLRGEELQAMLEENLEHTFSRDPFNQMGGYLKRCMGLKAYIKLENPPGQRIQHLYVGKSEIQPEKMYRAAFITAQGVPEKYGSSRQEHPEHIVSALRESLKRHHPLKSELRGTFTAI